MFDSIGPLLTNQSLLNRLLVGSQTKDRFTDYRFRLTIYRLAY